MAVSPIKAAADVLDRADELLKLDVAGTPIGTREDLRRQAWVMGIAAIDTYLHWAVHRVDLNGNLPKELRNTEVPLSDLVEMARSSVSARQKTPTTSKALKPATTANAVKATRPAKAAKVAPQNFRPTVRVRNALHRAILKQTFQGQRNVRTALKMLGVHDCWKAIGGITGEAPGQVTGRLDSLTKRRNLIAHEGDIERQSRPRKIKRHPIDGITVADTLLWVRTFITAMDTLVP
ncbi:hypothetical protein GCM10010123_17310 [Pilimelia anulata]|uniref:RiboL-PSP-HEPN domain-containing protein n=1 Tax=Pilimelia anulata TaxID=53371 RepID=A0A8J3F7F1_9ACTN|nr:hypothetical protein [Pilimelia anulata]GGJ88259.1 hypothetical protein GCM10010123_17310 [Pilimelia anulata]